MELKAMHIHKMVVGLNNFNYVVILYFIYKFYVNYKKISVTDSSSKLMMPILKVKRTVTQYVWFNLIIFAARSITYMYGDLLYSAHAKQFVKAASKEVHTLEFRAM